MSKCEAGHSSHKKKIVATRIGPLYVYDCDSYPHDIDGYCNGKDDISRTLIEKGSWEDGETTEIISLLSKNRDYAEKQRIIDFGCHIGWYSIIAADMGFSVEAFDNDAENLLMLSKNAELHGVGRRIKEIQLDIKEGAEHYFEVKPEVELIKMDLEGSERFAVDLILPLLEARCVKHIHMEVSPVFNDSYPELVQKIRKYGFLTYKNGELFDDNYNFDQANILFKREDLP